MTSAIMIAWFSILLVIVLRQEEGKLALCSSCYVSIAFVVVAVSIGNKSDFFVCYVYNLPPIHTRVWISELLNNGLMFMLTLRKGFVTMREYNHTGIANRLTVLLVKDSALYFFVYVLVLLIYLERV